MNLMTISCYGVAVGLSLVGSVGFAADSGDDLFSVLEKSIRKADTNRDGLLDDRELDRLSVKLVDKYFERDDQADGPVLVTDFVTFARNQWLADEVARKAREQVRPKKGLQPALGTTPNSQRVITGRTSNAPELPTSYKSKDKNGDGQIGLYEWERSNFAEFAKLDKNNDGFLTPQELMVPGSGAAGSTGSTVAAVTSTEDPSLNPNYDPITQEGKDTFARMDKNKDGAIDDTEWAASQRVRPLFEQANISPALPMDEGGFVINFRRMKEVTNAPPPDGLQYPPAKTPPTGTPTPVGVSTPMPVPMPTPTPPGAQGSSGRSDTPSPGTTPPPPANPTPQPVPENNGR